MLSQNSLSKEEIILDNVLMWEEFNEKVKTVFGRDFYDVDELYINVEKETAFDEWKQIEDCQALELLQELHIMKGNLCVITDLCYKKGRGPFVVEAKEIRKFVETFYAV